MADAFHRARPVDGAGHAEPLGEGPQGLAVALAERRAHQVQPGPGVVALKALPEGENTPIGGRVRWRKRTADKVVQDLRMALGVA